jgi:hypothetical protein
VCVHGVWRRQLAAESCMHDPIPGVCGSCHFGVFFGGGWSCLPVLLQVFLQVCLPSTQFIQCGEYRSAVKVSTCNNLPPPPPNKLILFCMSV